MPDMAAILENILTERILIEDFKSWLISDSLENATDKADFIPYFLNFLRENCAWLLSKHGKPLESPSSKLFLFDGTSNPPKHESATSNYKAVSPKKKTDFDGYRYEKKYSHNQEQNFFQDAPQNRKGYSGRLYLPHEDTKRNNNEHNFRKNENLARKNLNFNSARNVKNIVDTPVNMPDINSFDAFPPMGSKDNRNPHNSKMRRRITPTPVQAVHKNSSKFENSRFAVPEEKVSNEVFKKTPVVEMDSSDLQKEREMLKMTRDQFSQSATLSNNLSQLKIESNANPIKPINTNFITPDPDQMSEKSKLTMFSIVYDLLISNALVPNITSELYFIFELITARALPEEKPDKKNCIFCSVHNCVFFATSVLEKLKSFLHLLDSNTLSSLCEIPYLPKFSSNLVEFLIESSLEKQDAPTKPQSVSRVPFILEEDSCENFLDNHAFTSFRKQRDLFYELLREWQQQPLDCINSQFRDSFYRKAKNLINIAPNAVNIHHLAKLFQNQLIASCLGLEVSEVYDELLSNIQKNFPGKIEKLHQRFMMPFCVGGPSPPPTFYGTQAFFCELIQATSSSSLNQHLQDIFVSKILELNNSVILPDGESTSFSTAKEKYVFLLHTLRLVGKFLGYLHFLPYKISEPLSSNILNHQLISRKQSVPPVDVPKLLSTALENSTVILTVPWIVEYLSMADSVGKSLPYVQETLEILTLIYRGKYSIPIESLNFWFLRLIIGWLFDALSYPPKYDSSIQPITFQTNLKSSGIDFLAVIDKQLIHSCCPYLVEFKVLIYSFLNGIRKDKKKEVRKITPLSTTKSGLLTSSTKQQLQIQLEENFFFLQPPSLKKTVDFVSERIASKIIQKIRTEVTDFKLQSVESITNQDVYKKLLQSPAKIAKRNSYVDSSVLELFQKCLFKIDNFINITCHNNIENIMPSLLSHDIKPPVLKMCCEISIRLAVEKIIDWCDANLIFKDIKADILNKLNHLSKGEVDAISEDDFDVSDILTSLREFILQNLSSASCISNNYIPLLTDILSLMDKPIGNSTKKLIVFLVVDFYASILINASERYDVECDKILIAIWLKCPENCNLESYFLGVQNIKLLLTGKNLAWSCKQLDFMLSALISNKIFCVKKLKTCLESMNFCRWNDSKAITLLQFLFSILSKFDATVLRCEISQS